MQPTFRHLLGHRLVRTLLLVLFLLALALIAVATLGDAHIVEAFDECRALLRPAPGASPPVEAFCASLLRGRLLWSWALYGALAAAALAVWAWVATHGRR